MHRLEGAERVRRNLGVRHHNEIEIALVGIEVANRERAVKIHADKVITENISRSREHLLEHGVDLWVVAWGERPLGHGPNPDASNGHAHRPGASNASARSGGA